MLPLLRLHYQSIQLITEEKEWKSKNQRQNTTFCDFVCTAAEIQLHNRPVTSAIQPTQTVTSAQCQIPSLPTNLYLSLPITGPGLSGSDEGPQWPGRSVRRFLLLPFVCVKSRKREDALGRCCWVARRELFYFFFTTQDESQHWHTH